MTRQSPTLIIRFLFQVYVGLSELYCRLQDADKSARYAARAYDLSRSLQLGDLNSRHHRAALLQMAAALRKKGELGDAHDYCSVKFRLRIAQEGKLMPLRSKIRNRAETFAFSNDFERNVSRGYRQLLHGCVYIYIIFSFHISFALISRQFIFPLSNTRVLMREKP